MLSHGALESVLFTFVKQIVFYVFLHVEVAGNLPPFIKVGAGHQISQRLSLSHVCKHAPILLVYIKEPEVEQESNNGKHYPEE